MRHWRWLGGAWLVMTLGACDASRSSAEPGDVVGGAPSTDSAPWWSVPRGSSYFVRDGRQAPLLLRNATAGSVAAFRALLADAHAGGAQAVRVQLTQGFGYQTLGIDARGGVLASWAASWDAVFTAAQEQQLAVIPVFGIWGDWNSGLPDHGWSHFSANPLNSALGGPAASPAELFADSETQRTWLGWLTALVQRWHHYPNIIAWEVFSELDLATGGNEAAATHFAERASDVVRAADPKARPVFASTSDLPLIFGQPWSALWAGRGADLVSIHPYDMNLDAVALARVQAARDATSKPIFIGESGLDAAPPDGTTLTSVPEARAGLQLALWTELVSGAATARALYWEDGYAVYYPQTGLPLVQSLNDLETTAAQWLKGADFAGLTPAVVSTAGVDARTVTYVAGENQVRGFARSQALAAPSWNAPPLPTITLGLPFPDGASDGEWSLTFTPLNGASLEPGSASSRGGVLSLDLPGGFSSLAFVATRLR